MKGLGFRLAGLHLRFGNVAHHLLDLDGLVQVLAGVLGPADRTSRGEVRSRERSA